MNWVSFLLGVVKLVGALSSWMRDRGLIDAAQATLVADALEAQAGDVDKGRAARLAQRIHDAGGVRDDEPDPFRRD